MGKPFKDFMIVDGFLFKGNALCIPSCSLRLSIIDELHGGTLSGHFRRVKTLALVRANFYWPRVETNVARFVYRCTTCMMAKTRSGSAGLYTPLLVPTAPWVDVSLDLWLDCLEHKGVNIPLW